MATSATAVFMTSPVAGALEYVVLVRNTSPAPFAIYSLLIGAQYEVPVGPPFLLAGVQPTSAPSGWTEIPGAFDSFLSGETSFQGSAQASGYIEPGNVGTFVFQCATNPAPAQIPFGCGFWDGDNQWGFGFNGLIESAKIYIPIVMLPPYWRSQRQLPPPHPPLEVAASRRMGGPETGASVTTDEGGNVTQIVHHPPLARPYSEQ